MDDSWYRREEDLVVIGVQRTTPSQDNDDDDNSVCSRLSVKRGDGKSSFVQCVFNLSNKLMGVGLLGLPFALKLAGWVGGLSAFMVLAFVTWKTSIFIGRELNGDPMPLQKSAILLEKKRTPAPAPLLKTFPEIAQFAFGDTGFWVLSLIFYFELFSAICILFITIGDHLNTMFPNVKAERLTALAGFLSLVPTLTLTSPARMSYLSAVGTCCTLALVSVVVVKAVLEGDIAEDVAEGNDMGDMSPYHQSFNASGMLFSVGLVAFCFSGHAIVPSIYTSMKHPEQFEEMVTVTYLIVTGTCVAVAVSGYYMFGSTVLDQVTLSLERSPEAAQLIKCLTVLMVFTSFSKITLTMFPLTAGMEDMVAPFLPNDNENTVDIASASIKIALTLLALLVSVLVPSFSYVVALVGMICTMTVSVIFPSAAYLKMFSTKLRPEVQVLSVIFIIVGFIIAIAGTIDRTTGLFDASQTN